MSRIIIGFDPSITGFGMAAVNVHETGLHFIDCAVIKPSKKAEMPERLREIYNVLSRFLYAFSIGGNINKVSIAIESPFAGRNPKTAITLGMVRGVMLLATAQANYRGEPENYAPKQIKTAVTGTGDADKDAMRVCVSEQIIGYPQDRKIGEDEIDALGVCITHAGRIG